MQHEFNSVENELREIEEDFSSGQMNAFGTVASKEFFVSELRKIADIDSQVFYKACGLLSASAADDHLIRSMMFNPSESTGTCGSNNNNNNSKTANSEECGVTVNTNTNKCNTANRSPGKESKGIPPDNNTNSGGNHNNRNIKSNNNNSSNSNINACGVASPLSDLSASGKRLGFAQSAHAEHSSHNTYGGHVETRGAAGTAGDTGAMPWCGETGFSDRPFQEVSRHFKMLEGEFASIGEHLRQISTHVLQLNDVADRVRNTSLNHRP